MKYSVANLVLMEASLLCSLSTSFSTLPSVYHTRSTRGYVSLRRLGMGSGDDGDPAKQYSWNKDSMSQSLRQMRYAVRGEVVARADALAAQGRKIVYTNVGNPHAVGQAPLTFNRQVLALCDLPPAQGVDHPDVAKLFPSDAVQRARELLAAVGAAGTGASKLSRGAAAGLANCLLARALKACRISWNRIALDITPP